jgi:hypothetical protein
MNAGVPRPFDKLRAQHEEVRGCLKSPKTLTSILSQRERKEDIVRL